MLVCSENTKEISGSLDFFY